MDPQEAKTYSFSGQRVFAAPAIPQTIGEVDYLKNDPMGRVITEAIKREYEGCKGLWANDMHVSLRQCRENQPIPKGRYFFEGAVSAALDKLGITDIHVARPDQVMGVTRLGYNYGEQEPQFGIDTWNEFGVVVRRTYQHYPEFIKQIIKQSGVQEDMLPVFFFWLRSRPDPGSRYGVRLEYTEKSGFMPAPALEGENFRTGQYQRIEDLLSSGRERRGKLEVKTSDDGIVALIRRGDTQLDSTRDLFRAFGTFKAEEDDRVKVFSKPVILLAEDPK